MTFLPKNCGLKPPFFRGQTKENIPDIKPLTFLGHAAQTARGSDN